LVLCHASAVTRPSQAQQLWRLFKRLWQHLLRLEMPRQALTRWKGSASMGVALLCLLVALISSWPWLVEPSLRPGIPAPFTVRAPKAATVVDS
jgi:hypothetical protein